MEGLDPFFGLGVLTLMHWDSILMSWRALFVLNLDLVSKTHLLHHSWIFKHS